MKSISYDRGRDLVTSSNWGSIVPHDSNLDLDIRELKRGCFFARLGGPLLRAFLSRRNAGRYRSTWARHEGPARWNTWVRVTCDGDVGDGRMLHQRSLRPN